MTEDLYISLIYKQLTDSISGEELKQLEAWKGASEENQLTAESVVLAWNQSSEIKPNLDVNLDDAFNALEERINQEERKNNLTSVGQQEAKTRTLNRKWLSIAAGLVLLVLSGFVIINYLNGPTTPTFVEVTSDSTSKTIVLSDGTTVNLNQNSSLKYETSFSGKERKVMLKGEAFFEVKHNPEAPFIVETKQGEVKVLGTSFNVRANEEDIETQVQVVSGRVQLKAKEKQAKVILTAGNVGVLNKEKQTVQKVEVGAVNELFWHTKQLKFVETPLEEVLETLSKNYGVKFELKNTVLNDCPFNSTFDDSTFETIKSTIEGVLSLEIIKEKNTYILKGGKCE